MSVSSVESVLQRLESQRSGGNAPVAGGSDPAELPKQPVNLASILVVEDEPLIARQVARSLEAQGHRVQVAATAAQGLAAARHEAPDLVLLDLRLPDRSGLEVLDELRELSPEIAVVIMTAHATVKTAVDAVRRGARDYLPKPLDLEEVSLLVQRLIAQQRRDRELSYLRDRDRTLPRGLLGEDPRLLALFDHARRLAEANLPPRERPAILLTGETGTGKGVVARAIHEIIGGGPYLELNCAAMPATLVEAELFGHERGSFTDAKTSRVGLFEAADGGTLFLDEVGDLELGLQSRFLKVIEDKRVRRIGSTQDREVNVHVIAATHRSLPDAVRENRFRADLLHRLQVLSFEIPPLRDRPRDLRLLARHFAEELGSKYHGRPAVLAPDAEKLLSEYGWPGNVRELRNVMERAMLLHGESLLEAGVFRALLGSSGEREGSLVRLPEQGISLASVERDLITQALERTGGNRTRAAALLGLSRDTLRYRLEKWEIDVPAP